MPQGFIYRYELLRNGELASTGRLLLDYELMVGEVVAVGRDRAIVRAVEPTLEARQSRLVLEVADAVARPDEPSAAA